MPSATSTIVEPNETEGVGFSLKGSTSNTKLIKELFLGSPINNGSMTDESVTKFYQDNVMDGIINDGGYYFGEFNTSYEDAPSYKNVKTGGGGLPASAFVPNPVSPGEGSGDPADLPSPPEGFGESPNSIPFSGGGVNLDPKTLSKEISGTKLGDFMMGQSAESSQTG